MAAGEVVHIIKGLADVVKEQQVASKDTFSMTQQQIQDFSAAVQALSDTVATSGASNSTPGPLQPTLPEFTGRKDLNQFAEQLTNVLASSGVSAKFWLTHLKQQCRKDGRAIDIICNYETTNTSKIHNETSNDEYLASYDKCLIRLTTQ